MLRSCYFLFYKLVSRAINVINRDIIYRFVFAPIERGNLHTLKTRRVGATRQCAAACLAPQLDNQIAFDIDDERVSLKPLSN